MQFATLPFSNAIMSSQGRKRSSTSGRSDPTSKARSSPYNGDFEQKLIDSGIYPEGHEYSEDQLFVEPMNMEDIQRALRVPRASLSPSRFSEAAFRKFKRETARAANEASAMADVIPIIAGEGRKKYRSVTDAQFTNMAPILEDVTAPKPDVYDGARPEQIDPRVRHSLSSHIVPSKKTTNPAAPNFFLEGKSAAGRADVARRQACYDGAVGARAMHSLQNYGVHQPKYDGNAYSYANTFHNGTGTLQIYGTHPTRPQAPGGRPDYHITQIDSFAMTGNSKSFREGATAFRNLRDMAESHRNFFIEEANRAARHAPASSPSTTLTESQESRSVLYDQSDTSADELAPKESTTKRHRHRSTTSRGATMPPVEKRRDHVVPNLGKPSQHAVAEVVGEPKRRIRPTQRLIDSSNGNRVVKQRGRHDP